MKTFHGGLTRSRAATNSICRHGENERKNKEAGDVSVLMLLKKKDRTPTGTRERCVIVASTRSRSDAFIMGLRFGVAIVVVGNKLIDSSLRG